MARLILSCAIFFSPTASLKLESGNSTGPKDVEYHDIAVGVHTGGIHAREAARAFRDTMLRQLPNHIIMGDAAHPELRIEEAPPRYFCRGGSAYGPLARARFAGTRSTCTQFRFAYLFLTLRERFPNASWYAILDSDAWIDVDGTHRMLESADSSSPWLMGVPTRNRMLVYGPVLILNRKLSLNLDAATLMGCMSYWYFASGVFVYGEDNVKRRHRCSFGWPQCWSYEAKPVFDRCMQTANSTCGHKPPLEQSSCLANLGTDPKNARCMFDRARPEHPLPMYEPASWQRERSGDDHFFSFCTVTAGRGRVFPQPRFSYYPPHMPLTDCLCDSDVLAYHRLHPPTMVDLQRTSKSCGAGTNRTHRLVRRRRRDCVHKAHVHRAGLI